jgi:hypothetical protein
MSRSALRNHSRIAGCNVQQGLPCRAVYFSLTLMKRWD